MSDQDRISPYNINTYQADNWWEKKKYQLGNYQLIQNQILWTNFMRTVECEELLIRFWKWKG